MAQERTGSRTLLLGSGGFAAELAAVIHSQPQCGYELVGAVSAQQPAIGWCQGVPILGSAEDLSGIIARTGAIELALPAPVERNLKHLQRLSKESGNSAKLAEVEAELARAHA